MPNLSDLLSQANPPGSEDESLPTRSSRGYRSVPWIQVLLGFLRLAWPIARIPGWAGISRFDDVAEVLSRPDVFKVPFAEEMARLNDGEAPGTPFILGMDRPECHDAQLRHVMAAFSRDDIECRVVPKAAAAAQERVAQGEGRLEAIGGLITAVPVEICRQYYGVPIPDEKAFAQAAVAVSSHLFDRPPIQPKPEVDQQAAIVRQVVDAAIERGASGVAADTVLHRLLNGSGLATKEVRAFLIGMIVGFVPTNTIAGGHILEVLLKEPRFLALARQAALAGDDDLLWHCLSEALRFMPINFGPFRICARDFVVAAGTRRATCIPAGTKVLASTMSAMFDSTHVDRPFEYVPSRPASSYMHFGFGLHWCVGAFIARAQLVQTFKPLLLKEDLRRAEGREGRLQRRGLFPERLVVEYAR